MSLNHKETNAFYRFMRLGVNATCAYLLCMGVQSSAFGYISESLFGYYNINLDTVRNSMCKDQNIGNACVGKTNVSGIDMMDSSGNCLSHKAGISDQGGKIENRGKRYDEGATLVFIAKELRENGAKFCLTGVQPKKENSWFPWVVYYNPGSDATKCFWLCRNGFGGQNCEGTEEAKFCDLTEIKRDAFKDYRLPDDNSSFVESEDWMIGKWQHSETGCQENEAFVAISGWTPGGHGAFVSPMMARSAQMTNFNGIRKSATAVMYTVGDRQLMCAPGYKPNASKTDCEAVNKSFCDVAAYDFCENFPRDKFNPSEHTWELDSARNCVRYYCSDTTKAFSAVGGGTCSACETGARGGARKSDGVCEKCDTGQFFIQETGVCSGDVTQYSRAELQYGISERTKKGYVKDQCWAQRDPSKYVDCIKKQGSSTSNYSNRTNSGNSGNNNGGSSVGSSSGSSGGSTGGSTGGAGGYFGGHTFPQYHDELNEDMVKQQFNHDLSQNVDTMTKSMSETRW